MKAFFDEDGKLLYNSYSLPTSITSRQSQIESLYVIKRHVFNQIIALQIGYRRSSGIRRQGDIHDYISSLKPNEDISHLFMKESNLITYGRREQVNQVVSSIRRLYPNYKKSPLEKNLINEELFYIFFHQSKQNWNTIKKLDLNMRHLHIIMTPMQRI